MEQRIQYINTQDGVRIAYATAGEGVPLVKASNWLNHLEFDWQSPLWRPLLEDLARDFRLVRYDQRGNGLSDWDVKEFSLDAFVSDLEAVVDAAGLERFALLGISQGGAMGIAYALKHPQRVSHLILYGAYARGWIARGQPDEIKLREAMVTLVRQGWGANNPAFRQLWSSLYLPGGTPEEMDWFNELQRVSTTPEIAAQLFTELGKLNVESLLPRVNAPTLVLHCKGDQVVPFNEGRLIASRIPGAKFVALPGNNHVPLPHDTVWATLSAELRSFVGVRRKGAASYSPAESDSATGPVAAGGLVGHYRVIEKIGAGGMGVVYRARDTRLERNVALKVLPPEFSLDAERVARFEREARSASALNHPNIVTIYEVGARGALRYIAMELVEGRSLREALAGQPMPLHVLLRLATQIASGLAKAHEAGVIHRDLKPANIMVTPEGLAKIMDFGLAKLSAVLPESSSVDQQTTDDVATSHGTVMGTPAYMSPEQAKGEPADFAADQFSFGCILYEMATGKRPFQRNTHHHTIAAIIYEPTEPADRVNPAIPVQLAKVIARCLEKDPEHRYKETRRLARDLEGMQVGHMLNVLRPQGQPLASGYVAPGQALSLPASQTREYSFRDQLSARRRWLLPLVGVLAMTTGFILFGLDAGGLRTRFFRANLAAPAIKSIAVLPMKNLSGDPEQDYFADGMTESLIMELAQISALRKVTSHTSVMQYKNKIRKMPQIARDLSVDAVVEGSVQRSGERVQITVQLIDAPADRNLWSRSYERDAKDVLALQREMARAIAAEIRVQLTPTEETHLAGAPAVNPLAHDAYLRGRYLTDRRTRESLDKAVEYFQQAIAADPKFAPAYSGLSHAYREQEVWGGVGVGGAAERIRDAAKKALELDPNLADAHFALAASHFNHDWNWQAAEAEYLLALTLQPKFPEALSSYAYFLQTTGRQEEAIKTILRAVELAPTAVTFVNTEGRILYRARRYEEAVASFQRALELDQYYTPIYGRLAETYAEMGRYQEALEILERGRIALGEEQMAKRPLGYLYARMGRRRDALAIAREVERRGDLGSDYFSPAAIYAALGDRDRAFALLEAGIERRNILPVTLIDPKLDPLRSDPRFGALRRRMNLPEEQPSGR